jgi:hypothetical protein
VIETVPNVEKSSVVGKGTLLVSCHRNRWLRPRKLCAAGRPIHGLMIWRLFLLATSPSQQTSSLIREGPLQPPVVRRCLGGGAPLNGNQVFQKQRTGRVVRVEAVALELRDTGETAARQWRGRSSAWLAPSTFRTTKERTGKPDTNNAHY